MIKSDYTGQYPVEAVTIEKFAELIGKTDEAVRLMIKREKLPVVDFQDPNKPNSRVSETWIYLAEFNRIVREAYFNRPAEERDAWLKWLGL
ncbi:Cox family DNA-binding protein [Candidatus Hamiltonella endosymbiont of Tuberolachnus salignus]